VSSRTKVAVKLAPGELAELDRLVAQLGATTSDVLRLALAELAARRPPPG
jgi:hypothetical protein